MKELHIEKELIKAVQRHGGRCEKWVSGGTGVPDRLVLLPHGVVWFVELKRPGGILAERQKLWGRYLTDLEMNYRLIESLEEVRKFESEICPTSLSGAFY